MKTVNELRVALANKEAEVKGYMVSAREEKRDGTKDDQFKCLKDEFNALSNELDAAINHESELRSIPAQQAQKPQVGEISKLAAIMRGETRAIGDSTLARDTVHAKTILEKLDNNSLMRDMAKKVSTNGHSYTQTVGSGESGAAWVAEGGDFADASTLALSQIEIPLHNLTAYPAMTQQEVYQSNVVDLENWTTDKIARAFSIVGDLAFWYGSGVGQPAGLLTEDFVVTGSITDVLTEVETVELTAMPTSGDLLALTALLKSQYGNSAQWFMSRQMWTYIKGLMDSDGNPIMGRLSESIGWEIAGFKVNIVDQFTDADEQKILFGNLAETYTIVDSNAGFRLLRDEVTSPGLVKFPTFSFMGGKMVNAESMKAINLTIAPPKA